MKSLNICNRMASLIPLRSAPASLVLIAALVGLLPLSANAASRKKTAEPPADIYAPVPTPELDFNRYQVPPSVRTVYHFEANVSSWSPNSFNDSSFVTASNYKSGTPQMSVNLWSGAWHYKSVDISPKFGVSYDQLSRNGNLGVYGQSLNVTQVMNLYSLRAGIEVTPQSDFAGHLQPFLDLSVLPTWAQSPLSDLAVGSSHGYFSVEEVVGLNWHIPQLASFIGAENAGLEVGIEGTQGVAGSPLSGFGLLAGTRVEL